MASIAEQIPYESLGLVKYSGKECISRLGKTLITHVIADILCGENLRNLTEKLTQRRILLTNASLVITFVRSLCNVDNFDKDYVRLLKQELSHKLTSEQKVYLGWLLGLTGKSIQNVTRDLSGIEDYLTKLEDNLRQVASDITEIYGDVSFQLDVQNEGLHYLMKWRTVLKLLLAIGAQTLTIRGSEKSMYGKLFEKLVLGSLLSILGFRKTSLNDSSNEMIFWLSERQDKRESDATILISLGQGVRFDIGFIGRGNPEVSLDKVSRFERSMEYLGNQYAMKTIIIVDTIGQKSRIESMAKTINGTIIQMNGSYWVKKVAETIHQEYPNYTSPILYMTPADSMSYIRQQLAKIDIEEFFK